MSGWKDVDDDKATYGVDADPDFDNDNSKEAYIRASIHKTGKIYVVT